MNELHLVTGGAGFIGSHLVEALVAQGQRVRVFDDLSTGQQANLKQLDVELVVGDLGSPDDVQRVMTGVNVVYHLGAVPSVAKSVETPIDSHRATATGTLHVLDAARRAGVKRVVYAASSSAYGGIVGDYQRETDVPQALSPYAAAKLAGEYYCQSFTASYGLETVRLRFFNIFGPRQRADSPYSGVIALFIAAMKAGAAPLIHGDGLQSRDFTYVANAVQALQKAAVAPAASGNVYNVGLGQRVTVLDLLNMLNRLLKTELTPTYGPTRTGDVRHSCAEISRTKQDLGYAPDVSFEEGLRRTLEWYAGANGKS